MQIKKCDLKKEVLVCTYICTNFGLNVLSICTIFSLNAHSIIFFVVNLRKGMCIFIVCVLKCTYIQQSSCKLSQLQPNQTKPSCCNISWMIQTAVKHHGSTNQCELCFQIPLSVCVGKDVGQVEGGGWKPGRWHGRGAAEADVALGKFNAIGYDEKVLGEVGNVI